SKKTRALAKDVGRGYIQGLTSTRAKIKSLPFPCCASVAATAGSLWRRIRFRRLDAMAARAAATISPAYKSAG
ncbi:hypothetical protein AB0K74_26245, partial [Streptomyces sp. NPDC056159]|uniref:hypothetical protein n=1 Tax=Streptomyces sp. NPDC056159 TaxID=3155537 RepID=UPI00342D92EF